MLIDLSEYLLYEIQSQLTQFQTNATDPALTLLQIVPLLASVQDEQRMESIFSTFAPQTVYHTAAYKHVPLVEHNLIEGVKNNVFGTLNIAKLAVKYRVSNFVLVSTDKAVRPTSVMGATKRLAELILQAYNEYHGKSEATKFSMVRFGNVLESSGSVVPRFRQQIKSGGPLTLTHPEITRYFMAIPEAAQLIIQAGAMCQGGDVFLLDMGESVKIHTLAIRMIEMSGLTVRDEQNSEGDIEIVTTGLRPGEKLYEELLLGNNPRKTQHPRIFRAHENYLPLGELEPKLAQLKQTIDVGDIAGMRRILEELVSGYQSFETIVDWVHQELSLGNKDLSRN